MLDPDYLEGAGWTVGKIYRAIEHSMITLLASKLPGLDFTDRTVMIAVYLLARSSTQELTKLIDAHKDEISAEVTREIERAVKHSDAVDRRIIERGLGRAIPSLAESAPDIIKSATVGIGLILERENIAMVESAKQAFIQATAEALTEVNAGLITPDKAKKRAVRILAKDGIGIISYKNTETGRVTVRNQADVAVRRHIRSQMHQATLRLTEERLAQAEWDLVEVSSHTGSRPSHAAWQGRIYSLSGTHPRYRDFYEATGYQGRKGSNAALGDRLGGVNCRHSFAPYIEGMKRTYEPDPQHPSGKSNEEIYKLTQAQRRRERDIRAAKRERDAAIAAGLPEEDVKALAQSVRVEQRKMRELVSENSSVLQRQPRREWAGDRPR